MTHLLDVLRLLTVRRRTSIS